MQTNELLTPWVVRLRASPRARVRLFCFPYVGGSARVFRQWPQGLPEFVEMFAIQLPGRDNRLREEPFTSMGALVESAVFALRPFMDRPFAFFGHSMGAIIAFEMARLLHKEGKEEPVQLFVSGCRAPQLAHKREIAFDLPEHELIEELRHLKGTHAELLDNPELLQLFMPVLRADFKIMQSYKYYGRTLLACPITAFGGLEDDLVEHESLLPWRKHTTAGFSIHMLSGDHFFLHSSQLQLLEIIGEDLRRFSG